MLLFCYRCGGFVAAKCGLLTEVCRRWPANVGTQSRLRRLMRGVHPTRDVAVTSPWPVGRCPPCPTVSLEGVGNVSAAGSSRVISGEQAGAASGLPLGRGCPTDIFQGDGSGESAVARAVQAGTDPRELDLGEGVPRCSRPLAANAAWAPSVQPTGVGAHSSRAGLGVPASAEASRPPG